MLTNAAVKAARPRPRAYKLFDGRGLHLVVPPSGRPAWRMKFRFAGKEQLLSFGCFPEVSLAAARARCDIAREQLGRGEDPRTGSNSREMLPTFEAIARDWHRERAPRWTPVHAADVLASLEKHVFPAIGTLPIAAIDAPAVLALLQAIPAAETARRLRQRVSRVFRFAIARVLCSTDPAAAIAEELAPPAPTRPQAAVATIDEARALLAGVDALAGAELPRLAHRFLALTAVRLAAVRGARWCEIEDLDGPEPLWRIPAARMKLKAARKGDAANDHLVPLSPAAVAVLRAANLHRGDADPRSLIFPGRDHCAGAGKMIGEGAIGDLIDRAGFAGRHVPHGWRSVFSTQLNLALPDEHRAIDEALAHATRGKVEGAYNRSVDLVRRRRLFDAWAEMLTG